MLSNQNSRGFAHIVIVIIVLVILGVLTVIAISSRQTVRVDSRQDVEEILAKNCPSEEELAAAERYIQETKLDDLKDDLEAAKNKPECTIIQRITTQTSSETHVNVDWPDKCAHWGDGPRLVELVSNNPFVARWEACYDIYDTQSRQLIKEGKCESFTGTEEAFSNWYENLSSEYGSYIENDCRAYWMGEEFEIPVGFEDQYDFSDYQTEEYEPPLEPLSP